MFPVVPHSWLQVLLSLLQLHGGGIQGSNVVHRDLQGCETHTWPEEPLHFLAASAALQESKHFLPILAKGTWSH